MRTGIAISLAGLVAVLSFAGAMGVTGSGAVAAVVAVLAACAIGWRFWQRPFVTLDERAVSRPLKAISALATAAALFQLVRLGIFIVDPTRVDCAVGPSAGNGLPVAHSCLSAYFVAGQGVGTGVDVYAYEQHSFPRERPGVQRRPRPIGSFNIDAYEYPPPFLLLTRGLQLVAPDFLRHRMIWFALEGSFILFGLFVVARFLGPAAGTRALLLSPFVWASTMTISTLQIGNIQPMVIAAVMVAMVFFHQRRHVVGGALLAYVTVSKLFPGILAVHLLVRREWRALAWTVALSVALLAVSMWDTGWAPYEAFLRHLPGLLSGEAFPAFDNPNAIAKNYSIPGMVFKLGLFGLPGASFAAMKVVGWLVTVVLVAVTILVARRSLTREAQPLAWLAILILATLRSPFLPGYAVFPAIWLLTLLAATSAPTLRMLGLVLAGWAALNVAVPQSGLDPKWATAIILLPQAVIIILVVLALRRQPDVRSVHASEAAAVPLPVTSA
jgi:hypothetical protein